MQFLISVGRVIQRLAALTEEAEFPVLHLNGEIQLRLVIALPLSNVLSFMKWLEGGGAIPQNLKCVSSL